MSDDLARIDIDQVLQALAEHGSWAFAPSPDVELFRVELRRAARQRGMRVRTGVLPDGSLWAGTPDGLPAEEPWRGAVVHAHESGVMHQVLVRALDRLYQEHEPGD